MHCLVSEGGIGRSGLWRNVKHFNYALMRNSFRKVLLDLLENKLGSSFKKVKARCYRDYQEGYYIYAKPNKCDSKVVSKYMGRGILYFLATSSVHYARLRAGFFHSRVLRKENFPRKVKKAVKQPRSNQSKSIISHFGKINLYTTSLIELQSKSIPFCYQLSE